MPILHHDHPPHPLKEWRKAKGWSRETLAKLASALAPEHAIKARSLEAIENSYRRPCYELCVAFQNVTADDVTVDELRRHPLKKPLTKKTRRSAA